MVRFTTLSGLNAHVAKTRYPQLLIISARARMEGVEQCNEGGAEASLESNCEKITEYSMKAMRKYLEEQNAELRWEISELEHKFNLLEEKIKRFPVFKTKAIQKNVEAYSKKMKVIDVDFLRDTLSDLIHHITVNNEMVKIALSLHRLLDGNEPMLATIIEKRDNVAQLINHRKQNLTFDTLEVSL